MISFDPNLTKTPSSAIDQDGIIHQGTPCGPPHEGSRETSEGKIISIPKDYCWTPRGSSMVLVGYKIWTSQREAANLANTVRQASLRSHVKDSIILKCYGDEAGTGGGVISGTHNAECTPKTWSETVRFEKRNVVRDNDKWWMNHRNTWGVLDFKKDTDQCSIDTLRAVDANLYLAQAQAQPKPASPPNSPPPPAQPPSPANDNVFKPEPLPDPPPPSSAIYRLGRASIIVTILGLSGDTPLPETKIELPQNADATEISLFDQARGSFVVDDSPAARYHNEKVVDWYHRQIAAYQAQNKNSQNAPKPASQPNSAVRQSPSTKKLKCYNLNEFLKNKQNKPPKDNTYYIKEYCRQLRLQEAEINKMNVNQFNAAQANYAKNGRLNNQGSFKPGLLPSYIQQLMAGGMTKSTATVIGNSSVALHNPDQVWGNSVVNALGDGNVNSSIGGGARSRVAEFKEYLNKTNPTGNSKLNVQLCAELNGQPIC